MNAKTLFTYCLLACSALAGAEALADPILSSQSASTVNSIEFSFMSYSSTLAPYVSSSPSSTSSSLSPLGSAPAPSVSIAPSAILESPIATPTANDIQPVTEIYVPSAGSQPSTAPQVVDVSTAPAAAAVIPEPGTVALLGLGIALLVLRRREDFHA